MKRALTVLAAALLGAAFAAPAADSPKEDLKFLGIDKCKKDKFDCEWVDPSFSFSGKTIHVQKFKKDIEEPKGEDYGALDFKTADTFMQHVFTDRTNEKIEKTGCTFVVGGSGDYTLSGQITEFRYPKKGAAWGGWIGEAAGSGTIVYDWKISDKAGKTVVAVHHKIVSSASNTLERRVNNVHGDDMVDFVKKHAK